MSLKINGSSPFWIQAGVSGNLTPEVSNRIEAIFVDAYKPAMAHFAGAALESMAMSQNVVYLCWQKTCQASYLVGYVVAKHKQASLQVVYLALDPAPTYRRKGLGSRLMKKIFQAAKQSQLTVTLQYDGSDQSVCAFYDRFKPLTKDSSTSIQRTLSPLTRRPVFEPDVSLAAIRALFDGKSQRQHCDVQPKFCINSSPAEMSKNKAAGECFCHVL